MSRRNYVKKRLNSALSKINAVCGQTDDARHRIQVARHDT